MPFISRTWLAQRRLNVIYALAFVILGAGTIGQFVHDNQQADERAAALEQRVDAGDAVAATSNAQTRRLIRQLQRNGIEPVVSPTEVPSVPASAGASDAQIQAQVKDYFDRFPITVPAVDTVALQAAVTAYLTANPPPAGESASSEDIAAAVARELRNNPPPAGADGADGAPGSSVTGAPGATGAPGLSYVDVALDGCTLVFTRSDGQTRRVGPVCGADGGVGPAGPAGPSGVVAVVNEPACNGGDGYLASSTATYDADTATLTYSCSRSSNGLGGLGSDPS